MKYLVFLLTFSFSLNANKDNEKLPTPNDSVQIMVRPEQAFIDSLEKSIEYKTGTFMLKDNLLRATIPTGFKFIEGIQAQKVLQNCFNNPPDPKVLGLIFPADRGVYTENSYFFVVSYNQLGHVEDQGADKMNYDEILADIQGQMREGNTERVKNGFPAVVLKGWADKPFYDKQAKVLRWAKEVSFEGDSLNTLNYEIRVLGRRGVLSLQAAAYMDQLAKVKSNIHAICSMIEFTEGNKYGNFNPGGDETSSLGMEGLITGRNSASNSNSLENYLKIFALVAVIVIIYLIYNYRKKNTRNNPAI